MTIKGNHPDKDFIVTEHQLHAIEVAKFLACQRRPLPKEEASLLLTVWEEKVSEGYRACEIANNLGISRDELKKWTQYLEIKESIKTSTKKLIITVYIVRAFRALMELVYIFNLQMKNESFAYTDNKKLLQVSNKIIIIAPACAGKSTFSKKKEFCGYTLYDALDKIWDRSTEDYENFRLDFLRKHSGKVCAVDPFYKIKLFDDISVITVMPPKKIHIRNYKIRRKITPTFSMKKILKYRKRILKFSTENNLNIFPDFETALVQISEQEKMQS